MTKDFINFYGKNIIKESTLINGVKEFLNGVKKKKFQWQFVLINKNT